MNRTVLVGRLTKDPELRYTPNGIAITRFTLAVNQTFKNQNGERKTDFINIVVWRKQAENVATFLGKGAQVAVDGRIQTGHYDDSTGKRIYTFEVMADTVSFLSPQKPSESIGRNEWLKPQERTREPLNESPNASEGKNMEVVRATGTFNEDDLPF